MSTLVTAGQAIVASLIRHGVGQIFGIPGVHTYKLFDALHERQNDITCVGTRHEQGAAYMAYGYAKSTGKVGVYTCVPGPGMLNTASALCTAYAGNAPVLCVTSEIPLNEIGRGHGILHELPDQLATLRGLTKWSERISHPTQAPRLVARAFEEMTSGRPRPVALECPWDVLGVQALVDLDVTARPASAPLPDPDAVERAAKLILEARQPLIMLGSGAIGAREEVLELAKLLQAPVTAHRSGRGIVSDDSPYGLNLAAAYKLWSATDVLIAIGTRMELQFIRWKKLPPNLRIVRIDIDPEEMPRRKVEVGLVTDAILGTRALIDALSRRVSIRLSRETEFIAIKAQARKDFEVVQPQLAYLDVIRGVLPRDGFFVEEICQAGFTARYGFPVYHPRSYVTCGYQDNLGFGFMTALGVKAANPDKAVVSISGDGGFMFGLQELATAVQHKINLVSIVFNNRSFGNVMRDQATLFAGRHIGDRLHNPDFVKLSESFGVTGYRASSPLELQIAMERAFSDNTPALIEVPSEPGSDASPWPFLHPV